MSHVHEGPLAQYCSLTDRNLSGYFATTRMRRHLRRAGLIDKRGQIISENQYRLNMARKEHKKHVKDLLAQAIVHKTLDIERNRQVEIKRKLEEISKLELVRRVRAQKFRKGDEDILPYLSPRSSRPPSRAYRPRSAPADRQYNESYEADVIYVDDEGRPVTPPKELEEGKKREEIDTRHLYALDSAALKKYALTLSKMEQGEGLASPYLISQVPSPPRSARGSTRNSFRDSRYKQTRLNRPRTANSLSPYRSQRTGAVQGTLMLHRQEPAMMHQGEVQTLCEVTMKYYGPNLILPRDQRDPTQDVEIEQQHCGGNTLPVFKERIKPGDEFTFISRRHRGYPFSLSIFVEGRISARVSTCCEYGHAKGVRLGGKMGQFCLKRVIGATPCYKCKLNSQASPRTLKRPASKKKQQKVEEIKEEIIVLRPEKKEKEEDDKYEDDFEDEESGSKKDSGTEKYKDDFESEEDSRKEPVRRRSRSRSSSSSSSSSSSRSRSRSHTPTPWKESEDDRKIYGLRADEDVKKIQSEDEKSDVPLKIEGHSDEDEQPESKKWTQRQTEVKQRRGSSSSSSSSSSSKSSMKEKKIYVQPSSETTDETKTESTVTETHVSVEKEFRRRRTSSSDSDSDVKKYKKKLEDDDRRRDEQQRREEERKIEQERRREEQQRRDEERRIEQQRRKDEFEQREQERRLERQKSEEERNRREEERRREEEQRRWAEEQEKRRQEEKRKREEEDAKRREAYANRRTVSHISSTPDMDEIPEPVSYSTMLEDERQKALGEVKQEKEAEYVTKVTRRRSSSSSSSSSSSETGKEEPKLVTPPKVSSPYKKSSSSSSSSDSETDTGKEKTKITPPRTPSPAKITPPRSRASSSSSSSSSDSETETDAEKKVVKQPSPVPSPKKSSSSSSSSETETTTDTDQKAPKPVVPVKEEPKPVVEEKESSSSDSSDSETETQKETDNEKVPKQAQPTEPLVTIIESKKTDSSSSSSDSETETETATETETDNEKVKKEAEQEKEKLAPIQEKAKPSSGSSSSGSSSDSESDEDKPKPVVPPPPPPVEEKKEEVKTEVKKDTTTESSSGSSDSSSDSSDSEDEEKRKAAEKEKEESKLESQPSDKEKEDSKQEAPPSDQEKTNSDEPFISESEGEQKPVTIFASESDGDNMHGGNDPDNMASSSPEVKSYLTKIGVAPSQPVEGTVTFMIEGKKDLELNNIALTSSQVTEVADFLSKGDNVKSVCLRNAGIDDEKFESIAESLKYTKSKPVMLNFNLNKMKKDSVEKIVEVLIDKPSVEILLLHGNPLGDDGVKVLVNGLLDCHEAFRQHKEMEENENQMADDKEETERETTKYCVLKELDLGDTDIGDEGMEHIAHFLENDSDLKTLNLNGNSRVSYTGWKRLSKALKKNKTLQSLTLDFNKIGDEGIAALANGLKVNTSLQTLDLESTGLTEEGGLMLVDLVKCNTTILDITILPGNKILDKTQEEIRNYLGLNKAASSTMSESK